MPYYYWIAIIVSIIFVACVLAGLSVALGIVKPKRRSLLETSILEEEYSNGIMDFYKKSKTNEYKVKSIFEYDLEVYYLKNKMNSNHYIIMSHGHTYTHHGCLKYARMMMSYGFNIIMYDQPYHGNSGGSFTSLGHREKDDLYRIITDTIRRFGNDIVIGTYGESMGAVTVLLEAAFDDRVRYIFSDCGFSNLSDLMEELLKNNYKIPKYPFMCISNLIFKLITGVKYNGISPIKALKQISVPIFFAHGEADNFISADHTKKMYEVYTGPKKIFIGGNESLHASSYYKDTENYELSVKEFLKEFHILKMN